MGWMKDILNGVGDVADAVTPDYVTDPLLDIGRPFVEDGLTIGDPFRSVGQLLDTPRKIVSGAIGEANYWTSGARNALGITSDEDLEEIRKAYEEGGGRGVWEDATVNDLPWYQRALIDIGIDPLTYAGGFVRHLGKAGKLMDLAGETNTVRRSVIGGGEKVARVLNKPDQLIDAGLAKAGTKFMDSRGGEAVRTIGNTGFVRTARKKLSEQLEYTDYVKAKLQTDKAGDLVTQMLLGRRQVDGMFGFVDAQSAVPMRPDFGIRENADRNMVNLNPAIYRNEDRRIRQQSMFPLTDNLEDRSIQLWSERNPDARSRLLSTQTGKSQLDTRVPRTNNPKDDLPVPPLEPVSDDEMKALYNPPSKSEEPVETPKPAGIWSGESIFGRNYPDVAVDYSSMPIEEKIKAAEKNLSFSDRNDPLSEFNRARQAAERYGDDDSWIDPFLPNRLDRSSLSGDIPTFTTEQEAEQWFADRGVGLRGDSSFTPYNLGQLSYVAKAVQREVVDSQRIPRIVLNNMGEDGPIARYVFLSTVPDDGFISVNQDSKWWSDEGLRDRMGIDFTDPTPEGLITHELGHYQHYQNLEPVPGQYGVYRIKGGDGKPLVWEDGDREKIQGVSMYAFDSPMEFVAEVYAGIRSGKTYNADVMGLYQKFGGPPVTARTEAAPSGNPLSFSEQFDLINPENRGVRTPETAAVPEPEPVVPDPVGPSGARILDDSVPPLPRRAIKEELGRNTQEELRALRSRRSTPSTESLARSRTLTDLEDSEWSDMATKVEADIDGFVTTSEGTAFDLDPDNGFVEIAEPRGFRVPLAKVGTFSPGEGARVKEVIENYRGVLQQPDVYMAVERNADGTYGLNISIDALTRDEAQLIGAATNASHYIDPTNTQSGGRTSVYHGLNNNESRYVKPAEVEDLVQAIEDARIGEGSLIDNLRDGDQIPEASFAPDLVGPQMEAPPSGAFDPTAQPFETRNFRGNFEDRGTYTKRTIKELNERARGVGVRQAGSDYIQGMRRRPSDLEIRKGDGYFLTEKIDPLEPQKKSWSPFLAQDENEALFDVYMSDGVSIGDYALHAHERIEADKALFAKAGVTWGPEETTHAMREVYKRYSKSIEMNLTPAEQKLIKQRMKNWDKLGLNPEADSVDSARHVVQGKMMDDSGVTPPHQGKMARMRSIWSAVTLTSPRYIMGNLTTNIMDSMIAGHFRFDAYADFWRIVRSEMSRNEITDFIPGSKMEEYFGDVWGFTSDYAIHNRTQRNLTGAPIKGDSEVRKLARALHIERSGVPTIIESVQAMAQSLDTVSRASMAMDVMDNVRYREMPGLLSKLDAIIEKSGVDLQGRQVLPKMDPAYIYSYYRGMGVPDGLAQRASRDVAEVRSMARKEATAEVERVALSYRRTKLDEKVASFVPFHYWASRKFRWYAEEAYRNPVLLANYARAIQGLERADDDPGLNARQKGFLRLFGGPTGFTMLMNPDAMMGVIRASQLNNTYQADGETELGGILNFLQRYGIGLYPWLDGAANMIGAQGDTFEPDMIGIRHRGIIGAIVNYARGEGWLGEDNRDLGATPYADINMEAREKISTWVSTFTPDWISQPVPARDKSIVEASIESTIESRIIAENPGITNQELIALMNDPESDAYQSAFQDAARAGVIGQLISFSAPLTVKVRENTKDVRGAAYGEVKKAAAEAGIPVSQFDATDADAEFRAAYKSKTGKEFTLDDFNKMNLERDLINAANPDARNFILYDMEYRSIGQGKAKQLGDEYYNLRNGSDARTMHLPQEEREQYAKAWAERSGAMPLLKEMWDLQASYKQSHPMFAQWKEWQSQMHQLQKMSGNTLAEYRRMVTAQNPSAAAYFRSQQQRLEDAGIAPEDMSRELDRITVSPNAWFAINGMPRTHSDPSMSVGAGDPMFGQLSPYTKTSYDQPVVAPTGQNGAQWTQALANRGQ